MMSKTRVVVTQTRSVIRHTKRQKETLQCLGLGRIGRSREHELTPSILGMLKTVSHLVVVDYQEGAGK